MYKLYQTDSPGIGTKAGWEELLLVWKPKKVIVIDITQCVYVCVSHKLHLRRQRVIKTHESPLQCRGKEPSVGCFVFCLTCCQWEYGEKDRKAQVLVLVLLKARQIMWEDIWIWFANVTSVLPPHPRSVCTLASGGVCTLLMRFCHKDLKKSLDDWEHIPVDS